MDIETMLNQLFTVAIEEECKSLGVIDSAIDVACDNVTRALEKDIDNKISDLRDEMEKNFSIDMDAVYKTDEFKKAVWTASLEMLSSFLGLVNKNYSIQPKHVCPCESAYESHARQAHTDMCHEGCPNTD